jgi:folate-binding protein YgfZ
MSVQKTPLFTVCGARGAMFSEVDGWFLAGSFAGAGPAAEAAAARATAAIFDLCDHAVMKLEGPDARRFCNGMFTNNVRNLPIGCGNSNAMVDDKARIQGLLDLWRVSEVTLLAVLHGVTAEAFEARYAKYIVFDDVELTDERAAYCALSVQGPNAADVLTRAGLPVPADEGAISSVDALHVMRRARSVAGGFDVLVPREAVALTWEALVAAGAAPAGRDALEILRVEAGMARWPVDMSDKSLVHELRLVERCVSFDKGCYIGQEIINRLDVMGQVTKKIWGLELLEDALPPRGAEVRLGEDVVGATLSGARDGARVRVLALLRKAAWTPGAEVEVHANGRVVRARVSDLPFRDTPG